MTTTTTPALSSPAALALIQDHLRKLRDWRVEAEDGMARVLQESAVSVEHAEYALKKFDDRFPSPRELTDAMLACKGRFHREPTLREKWEAEGYRYTGRLTAQEIMGLPYKAGTPTKHELMWAEIRRAHPTVKDWGKVSWGQIYQWQKELGFPLNQHERETLELFLSLPESKHIAAPSPISTPPIPEAQARASHCAICHGTGRTDEGSYCTCVTGRDLARVESPVEKSDADEDWDSLPSAE